MQECRETAAEGLSHARHHADQAHGRGPDRISCTRRGSRSATCTRDVETLERIELIRDLRLGVYDVLVGINLLREGLDIPECGLVAILDADKEGFLRSETSLIQTIGRAARNVDGTRDPLRRPHHRIDGTRDRRNRPPPREAARLQRRARHHARDDQARHRRHRRPTLASRDQVTVDRAGGRRPHTGRPQSARLYRGSREAHAQGGRRSRVRGSRAPARRDPQARERGTRPARRPSTRRRCVGESTLGKPGTRKTRYGKTQRKWGK